MLPPKQKLPGLINYSSNPLLYLITDHQQFRSSSSENSSRQLQLEAIALAAQAGCQLIQIREKDLSVRELREFTNSAKALASPHGAKILVNDRVDVALAVSADGVHLRANSVPVTEVRKIVSQEIFLIGVSTHSITEAQTAEAGKADFIVCGPVYPTPSKSSFGEPLGLQKFAEICRAVRIPVLALGGITIHNFAAPLAAGAAGIAGIGLFEDISALVTNTRMMLSSKIEPQD